MKKIVCHPDNAALLKAKLGERVIFKDTTPIFHSITIDDIIHLAGSKPVEA